MDQLKLLQHAVLATVAAEAEASVALVMVVGGMVGVEEAVGVVQDTVAVEEEASVVRDTVVREVNKIFL